jgi:hypothetical protein
MLATPQGDHTTQAPHHHKEKPTRAHRHARAGEGTVVPHISRRQPATHTHGIPDSCTVPCPSPAADACCRLRLSEQPPFCQCVCHVQNQLGVSQNTTFNGCLRNRTVMQSCLQEQLCRGLQSHNTAHKHSALTAKQCAVWQHHDQVRCKALLHAEGDSRQLLQREISRAVGRGPALQDNPQNCTTSRFVCGPKTRQQQLIFRSAPDLMQATSAQAQPATQRYYHKKRGTGDR